MVVKSFWLQEFSWFLEKLLISIKLITDFLEILAEKTSRTNLCNQSDRCLSLAVLTRV